MVQFLEPETYIMVQFLATEIDVMGGIKYILPSKKDCKLSMWAPFPASIGIGALFFISIYLDLAESTD